MPKRKNKWIQKAIKKEGALSEWIRKNRAEIEKAIGRKIPEKLNITIIDEILKAIDKGKIKAKTVTVRRLNLAKTLIRLSRKRKR